MCAPILVLDLELPVLARQQPTNVRPGYLYLICPCPVRTYRALQRFQPSNPSYSTNTKMSQHSTPYLTDQNAPYRLVSDMVEGERTRV